MSKLFRKFRKAAALALALLMVFTMQPVFALAAQENTSKEEVIYVNLNADGSVKEINVVNIFDLKEAGTIVDYGEYAQLRNMTSTAPIRYDNGKVSIEADAGKLYYEGKLSTNVMPWNIGIRYFLDGKEYPAEQIGGKSGALAIKIDITRNEESDSNFFDGFALQLSLSLDTAKCSNISAPDATVANVGSNKQLTHTILPGNGAELEITADVVNFTMDGISINAIPLNLNVEVDDAALMGKVKELLVAIEKLDEGAKTLKDGVSSLQSGAKNELQGGVSSLVEGAALLESGAGELQSGGAELQSGAQALQSGAAALDAGIQALNDGIIKVQEGLNTLDSNSGTLNGGSTLFLVGLNQLRNSLNKIAITTEDLSSLKASSAEMLDQINGIVSVINELQQSVSFSALKTFLAQKGVSVDSLRQDNSAVVAALRAAIDENKGKLEELGVDTTSLIGSMEQAIGQLEANNSFIDGTESYLNDISGKIQPVVESAVLLHTNYALLDAEINAMTENLDSLAKNMTSVTNSVNSLVSQYKTLDDGIGAYTDGVAQVLTGYAELVSGSAKLAASSGALKTGADALYSGIGELLDGVAELYKGTGTLKNGTGTLQNGTAELIAGIAALYDGSQQLADGTATMRDQTVGMDSMVSDKVNEMLANITGENVELQSFTSEKNTSVESVQFVIKTVPITAGMSTGDQTDEPSFWEKIFDIFGF